MKTIRQEHAEEQIEAILASHDLQMRIIERNHRRAVRRIDLFAKVATFAVLTVAFIPLIVFLCRLLKSK